MKKKNEFRKDTNNETSALKATILKINIKDNNKKIYDKKSNEFKFWKNVVQESKKIFIKYYVIEI